MGSADAFLAYGYDLGGVEGWKVREANEHGMLQLSWYDDARDSPLEFDEKAERLLLASAGFTETSSRDNDGYAERLKVARARLGVEIITYYAIDAPRYLLATHRYRANWGAPKEIPMLGPAENDHRLLTRALATLGLTPTAAAPRWLLTSLYG